MITLPPGFDPALLVSDFSSFCIPFVYVGVLIASAKIIMKILKRF